MQTFGPYSPIRRAGNTYYISGQVGVNVETKKAPADAASQTERALLNLENVLKSEGLSLDDVVKTTIFTTVMEQFGAINAVYEQRFNTPRPARATVGVAALPNVADVPIVVEIEAVAYREPS